MVLVPACAFVLAAVLVRSANGEHGLLRPLLEFVVLITSLQIGYVFGLALFHSHSRRRMPRRAGELLKAMERRRLGGRLIIGCRIRLICRNQKPSRSLASRSSNHRTGRGSRRLPNGNSKSRLRETRRLPCGFTLACLQARLFLVSLDQVAAVAYFRLDCTGVFQMRFLTDIASPNTPGGRSQFQTHFRRV